MRPVWILCLLLVSTPVWNQAAPPQQPEQAEPPITTLKVTTRVVAISAVVKSKDGEPRAGLTKDDFVLKQDGREEPIRYFSQGSALPLTLALMVDTSGSQRTFIGDESLASDVFFETMLERPEDQAMLVQFDYRVLELKGMTNSANELHLALSLLSSRAAPFGGTLLNDAVYTVAKDFLAKKSGRKAMVILTDGGDNGSRRSLAEAIEQAQRADVQVYSILYSMWNTLHDVRPGPTGPKDPGLAVLQALSESTGGRVFTVSRTMSLRAIFAQIGEDLRLQYELGYTPPADTAPNSYHKLELKAKDKKLSVQARKGFFAQP
jgi:Ca-activated chloride channel family protein